ncbi:MAG: hypothetical protein M1812_004451 [Candelaria pacifica]|nr:MAG: hypothetical protein M1812_004451 [Candelaria pacifica]
MAIHPVKSKPLQQRDADFYSVRTRLAKDRSGKGGDPKDKYFHESTFHPHLDGRFADLLLHTTKLEHKILPWDSDVDVQVSESSMHILANYYNMTVHRYETLKFPQGRTYMLEINPHYVKRGIEDRLNVIDGRWIDTETGMFIDITTVRKNETAEAEGIKGALMCKDKHHYLVSSSFLSSDKYQLLKETYMTCAVGKGDFPFEAISVRGFSRFSPLCLRPDPPRRVWQQSTDNYDVSKVSLSNIPYLVHILEGTSWVSSLLVPGLLVRQRSACKPLSPPFAMPYK